MRSSISWIAIIALVITALPAPAEDWPEFLGPRRNGVCAETGLNLDWKDKPPKVAWKVSLGAGFGSMAIVGDRIYTTVSRDKRDWVVGLSAADGKELWAYDAGPTYLDEQKHGPGPRSTPTFRDGKLYCYLPRGELLCLKADDGKKVWEVNAREAAGAKDRADTFRYWGQSMSPLVDGDLVIAAPGGPKDSSVMAFHKDTGKKVWGVGDDPSGYASPILVTVGKTRQLICPTGQSVLGVDPKEGKLLWRYALGNPFDANAASPVWAGDRLFVSAAYGAGSALLKLDEKEGKWDVSEVWTTKSFQNLMATSVIHDGHLYGCHGDLGAWSLQCLDMTTGKDKWRERLPCRFCVMLVEGQLVCVGEKGQVWLVECSPKEFARKAELKDLLAPKAWAMPALANKRLYLRDQKHLVCVDLAK